MRYIRSACHNIMWDPVVKAVTRQSIAVFLVLVALDTLCGSVRAQQPPKQMPGTTLPLCADCVSSRPVSSTATTRAATVQPLCHAPGARMRLGFQKSGVLPDERLVSRGTPRGGSTASMSSITSAKRLSRRNRDRFIRLLSGASTAWTSARWFAPRMWASTLTAFGSKPA